MRLSQAVEARLQQSQRIDPRQILASEILTWTASELEAAIERELAENPALEAVESEERFQRQAVDPPGMMSSEREWRLPSSFREDDGDEDPMERVASSLSFRDHLRQQAGQVASGARAALVRDLIEYVDERGYLSADLDEIACDRMVAKAEVEAAVHALQCMEPAGVGARDLRECMMLQATYLEQVGEGDPLALPILSSCWDELVTRREARIASRLGVGIDAVRSALSFLQKALTPYPGSAFRQSWESRPANTGHTVRPDLMFRRTEAGFVVEVPGDLAHTLTLAPLWQRLADRPDSSADDAMRRYIREHVERVEGFLQGLARRGRTLRAIAQALVELQHGYLETGNRSFLRPLTRASLSERLGLDESVISRAVADKFAQLPSGEVMPLDAFFGSAHAVREALVTLVADEDSQNPYSDDDIADILTRQGFPLARRTVAKYRGLEKILPARLRKRA